MDTFIKKKIDSYLANKDDRRPLIVDISSLEDMEDFLKTYCGIERLNILSLAKDFEIPSVEDIYESLNLFKAEDCIVSNLSSLLQLEGKDFFFQLFIHC